MTRPDFIGIGAQKAATTWIYDVLSDHPQVALSATKEVDFFSRHFDRGYAWYERHFESAPNGRIVGELSPSYLNEPAVPQRVAAYAPNVKIIVSLRDPVSRAISNHKHEVRIGHFGGADLSLEAGLKNNPSYVDQGRYATHLTQWMTHFPRESILVLLYDDIVADPAAVARQIYGFLGIDEQFSSQFLTQRSNIGHLKRHPRLDAARREMRLALARLGAGWLWERMARLGMRRLYRRAAWIEAEDQIPPVTETQKQQLRSEFQQEIEQLESLLGVSLASWKQSAPASAPLTHDSAIEPVALPSVR